MIPCIQCDTLMGLQHKVTEQLEQCQAVLINEAQFFPDLLQFVEI